MYGYEVVMMFLHDREAYTQGLLWDDRRFVGSAGLYEGTYTKVFEVGSGRVVQ